MSPAGGAEQLVYGPVPSRRLGRSLGVDLVPFKTCTYDCVYCQLGRTTRKTVRRQRWVDPSDVVAQVRARLESEPDVIALAGSGEPTLHAGIGDVIAGIKRLTDVPVAVITNGSLLSRPTVRRGLAAADIVLPSLDAPDDGLFQLVNRPHEALRFDDVVGGMIAFRNGYRGQMWLEVMLLAAVTGGADVVERLAELAARIAPDRIQLNTAVRPPAESFVAPVADGRFRISPAVHAPRRGDRRHRACRRRPSRGPRGRPGAALAPSMHGGRHRRRPGDPPRRSAQGGHRPRR